MSNQLRLSVGIPAYGSQITAHQANQWMQFGATAIGSAERFNLCLFSFVDANPIDRARNMLLDQARKASADWLLMLDADTWVESDHPDEDAGVMLLRMISDADRRDASIVVAPVLQRDHERRDTPMETIYRLPRAGWTSRNRLIPLFDDDSSLSKVRHLVPCDAAGSACIAINIKRTQGLSFRFNYELGLSEDIDFCRQVKERNPDNESIFVDPRVRTGHTSRSFPLYSR